MVVEHPFPIVGVGASTGMLTAAVLGFWTWSVTTGGDPLLAGAGKAGAEGDHGEHVEHGAGAMQSGEHDDEDGD